MKRREHILKYFPFRVNTDTAALKRLQTIKNPEGVFFRWLEELSEFMFKVGSWAGRLNLNADNLSRCDHLLTKQEEEQMEVIQEEELNLRNIGKGQQEDPTMTKVRGWIMGKANLTQLEFRGETEELHRYAGRLSPLSVNDTGIWMRNTKLEGWEASPSKRRLVPSNWLDAALGWSHQHSTVRYFRVATTVYKVQQRFLWPEMNREMQQKVAECVEHIKNDQVVNNRNAHQYQGGKYLEIMERGLVWYSHSN